MANDPIRIEYNEELKPLEELLAGVKRAGDFFVSGTVEIPMPKLEVEGVGVVSFPVPPAQIAALIQQATRAPYGRGEATLLDESVRKVWQLPPDRVRIGGKSWAASFDGIFQQVIAGLGCAGLAVSAELYKLLVYDTGGFFLAHRDTEKAGGMFGTLVVVLPSAHRGGELVIRHAGRETVVDLSGAEVSEAGFAAFYADCEHEVRPITEGNRVCLVYNLIQQPAVKGKGESLQAPDYEKQIAAATALLEKNLSEPEAPAKIAWLLEHQYSPDGLSFAGLKSADAARVKVLRLAAERAGCAAHLGIVHIEESGSAQENYHPHHSRRWGRYQEDEREDVSSKDFEIIEVCDWRHYVAQWRDPHDQPADFGELPLEPGELLPAGALDDEKPDEQRLMEASGNEGASFERSYHRAALVIWPRERYAGVLLQAGVSAALPHLRDRLAAGDGAAAGVAGQIIEVWENPPAGWSYRRLAPEPSRTEMLRLLVKLGDEALLQRFISGVVTREFDGSDGAALAAAIVRLGSKQSAEPLTTLARENMPLFHRACLKLLGDIIRELAERLNAEWQSALSETASVMVEALPKLKPAAADPYAGADWQRKQKAKPVDGAMVADLLASLRVLRAAELRTRAVAGVVQNGTVFDPAKVIVPALTLLQQRERNTFVADADCARLWVHAAEFLLARSEHPPAPPTDWRQPVSIACKCEDCRALQTFALDAQAQEARFRVREDRRQHLQQQIEHHGLDMTRVTEKTGSPKTLVCTKTRRTFQRQCDQHRADGAGMNELLDVMRPVPMALAKFAARLAAARERQPQTCP